MTWFDIFIWVPHTLYACAIVPQIIKNYRLKSTHGLSLPMIFSRFSGEVSYIFYIYLLGLPMVYRVMIPIYTFNLGLLLVQAAWYAPDQEYRTRVFFGMVAVVTCAIGAVPLVWYWPVFMGKYAGWLAVCTLAFSQAPQVYKNYKRQSVHGFSLVYTLLMGAGSFVELLYVVYLQLPVQTLASCTRSLLFYTIYWYQFIRYAHDGIDEPDLV